MIDSTNKRKNIFALLLVCIPILNQYMFFPLTFWEILCIGIVLYSLLTKKITHLRYPDRFYGIFCAYLVFSVFFSNIYSNDISITSFVFRFIKIALVSFAVLFLFCEFLKYVEDFKYWMHKIMWLISWILIFQLLMYYLFGRMIYPIIPNMTLNYNDGINSSVLINNSIQEVLRGYYFRPSSVFLEPAHYATFSVIGIIFELFDDDFGKQKVVSAIFFSICTVLTTSSLSLVLCAMAWVCFLMYRKDLWKSNSLRMLLLIIFVIPIAIYFLAQQEGVLTSIVIKLTSLSDLSVGSSTSVRLLRGLQYFKQMGFVTKIFGVGYGGLSEYYYSHGINIIGDVGEQVSYMNGISTILCSVGVVGVSVFVLFVISSYKKINRLGKSLLVCFMLALFTSDMFNSPVYYLIIILVFMLKRESYNNQFAVTKQ